MSLSSRTRSACDRCHSQKLRCPKQTGSVVCARCVKADAKCVYSPPGTSLVTTNGESEFVGLTLGDAVPGVGNPPDAFGVAERSDWASLPYEFDFASTLPITASDMAQPRQDHIQTLPVHSDMMSTEGPSGRSYDARSACTRELTSLFLDSDEIWTRFSLDSGLHSSQVDASDAFLKALSAKLTTRHILESFFVLAQRLIDVYPSVISISLTPASMTNNACDIPDCTHLIDLVSGLKEVEDGILQQGTFAGPDISLLNLLITCHGRQLDILDRLFLLVTSCTRATLASRREPDFDVSEIRVGSYVPQRTAAVLMQMALLKHLVAGLADRLVSFGEAVSAWPDTSTSTALESSILKLRHESMTKRHAIKVKHVRLIEEFLLEFDFNKG